MKGAVLENYLEPLILKEINIPKIGENDILMKVKACGICGTDVKIWSGKKSGIKLPLIMGHEAAGEIVEVGKEVENVKSGERGIAYFYLNCGSCYYCQSKQESLCSNLKGRLGFSSNGGFAEFLSLPAENFIKIPDNLSFKNACIITDAISTTYHALKKAEIKPHDYVLVMGLGGLGIHGIQVAKYFGANVIGVDIGRKKLDLAYELGFRNLVYFDQNKDTYRENVLKITNGKDISVILETVSSPLTIENNINLLGKAGKLILNGYQDIPVSIQTEIIVSKELSILGSRACSKKDVMEVINLVNMGIIKPIITKEYKLEEINMALENLRSGNSLGRQVIIFD